MATRTWIVDRERSQSEALAKGLSTHGLTATVLQTPSDALTALGARSCDVLLADLDLDGMTGLELCARARERAPGLPVMLYAASPNITDAVAAMRAGATDFLCKPLDPGDVARLVARAVAGVRPADAPDWFSELHGASPAMTELRRVAERIAAMDVPVLVTGESGVGKELLARAIHRRSRRREKPLVAVNCAALPDSLLEAELFGHVRGAFTDARTARRGLFLEADGGTLMLDEVGELSPTLQPKLLRVLQEKRIRPIGSDREIEVDVRVIAATNRNLEVAVWSGQFREDLWFRLNGVHVELPPLRDRDADVLLLAEGVLARLAAERGVPPMAISLAARECLLGHPWPGNVRELQNCMEAAATLATGREIDVADLPETVRRAKPSLAAAKTVRADVLQTLGAVERQHVLDVLASVGGNKRLAARILGLDRTTLYRKLEAYRREWPPKRSGSTTTRDRAGRWPVDKPVSSFDEPSVG